MGFFDDLKFKREANKQFQEQVALVKADIGRFRNAAVQASIKLSKLVMIRDFGKVDEEYFKDWNRAYLSDMLRKPEELERAIADAYQERAHWEQTEDKAKKELAFMRPNTKKDIEERRAAFVNFAKDVLFVDPDGELDLRFHSTSLATTRDILRSGGLISSVDRLDGFVETTNYSNEISVSGIRNIQYSINYWTDIEGYNGCRPCGCMFVLQPRSQEEADMIPGRQMHNVLFCEHPKQLVAIVTTSENVERVRGWLREKGLPESLVCRFDEFASVLESEKDSLVPEYRKFQKEELAKTTEFSSVDSVISGAKARSCSTFHGKSQNYTMEL